MLLWANNFSLFFNRRMRMQVFKIEQPLVAFKFVATDKGNNFDELSADVVAAGGTAEQLGDALAQVRGVGAEVRLPLGFGVVYDGGVAKVLPAHVLDSQYVEARAGEDLDDLVARLEKVEKAVAGGKGRRLVAEIAAGDGTE